MSVTISAADFDVGAELAALRAQAPQAGALVSFVGLVRDFAQHGDVAAIELEHYPAMTQKVLESLQAEVCARWPLLAVRIIHRIGHLAAGEQIVLVAVASHHRHAAFEAAACLMDFLKTQAPFWKKEYINGAPQWVDAKDSDSEAAQRWH